MEVYCITCGSGAFEAHVNCVPGRFILNTIIHIKKNIYIFVYTLFVNYCTFIYYICISPLIIIIFNYKKLLTVIKIFLTII